jgi:DNA-binding MarR family transcriptional regulator/N-acetylglutamate synthase-like GNAT family acetyltransferase
MIDFVPVANNRSTMREIAQRAEAVRAFNRFYTRRIGVLGEGHLGTPYSLTEVRVLFELAHTERPTASEIAERLGLDRGYLSRTLRAFKKRGLLQTEVGPDDRRQTILRLTAVGKKVFAQLDEGAREEVVAMLAPLGAAEQKTVLTAMDDIRRALGDPGVERGASSPYLLREPRAGDMGWIVHRHGVVYAKEYGWDERFEALVAEVVAQFVTKFDASRERCWIAERKGEMVGCVFVAAKSKTVAKLRLLLVEPSARGLGLGTRLVDEVIRFARVTGYRKLELWTHPELKAARKIYKAAGFELVSVEQHALFGKPLTAETWARSL